MADHVPTQVTTYPVKYVYSKSELLIPYGVSLACALCCAIVGMYAFQINDASYQNIFSTFLRATNGAWARECISPDDEGADPLPKSLAKIRLGLHEQHRAEDVESVEDGGKLLKIEHSRPNRRYTL